MSRNYRRLAGLAGLVMFAMAVIGFGFLLSGFPEATAPGGTIAAYFAGHQLPVQIGIVVVMLSMPFYLFFASAVLIRLRESDVAHGENFAFGAAVGISGTAALVILQGAIWGLLASGLFAGAGATRLKALFALGELLHPAAGVFLLLWYACVGIAGLRHHRLPAALCWPALALAVVEALYSLATVGLGGSILHGFDPVEGGLSSLWTVAVSIWLLTGGKRAKTGQSAPQRLHA
ncbi:MAG: hypothetical protein M0Z53_14415 [Thermaerobacter sp.]|nr:hypothetical protein [Thermaerobacter sp.]